MTYIATDARRGNPIELITFSSGGDSWRYTSSANDVVFSLLTYEAKPIDVPAISSGKRLNKNNITIRCSKELGVLAEFKGVPSRVMNVIVQEFHANDPDLELVTRWVGEVNNISKDELEAKIQCVSTGAASERGGISRNFQAGCPYDVYGEKCAIPSANFRFTTTVIGVSNLDLTLANMTRPDDYYAGGIVEWNNGNFVERRTILTQTGSVISMDFELVGIPGNASVNIYPGCNHTVTHCTNKFDNYDNYGGQPYYSPDGKNPMNGDNVF